VRFRSLLSSARSTKSLEKRDSNHKTLLEYFPSSTDGTDTALAELDTKPLGICGVKVRYENNDHVAPQCSKHDDQLDIPRYQTRIRKKGTSTPHMPTLGEGRDILETGLARFSHSL
jgi:hypothetical protein